MFHFGHSHFRQTAWLIAVAWVAAMLVACQSGSTGPKPSEGDPRLEALLYNPNWYRTFDSSSDIIPSQGALLFAWTYGDALKHPDSFYVGIDTLWSLPQQVDGDTSVSGSWDLQVCPDGYCMLGLQAGVHGANAPVHFEDTTFQTEHHFEYFPAIDPVTFKFKAPDSAIVGAMMWVQSRSTGKADTAFAFGAWKLGWDSAYLPPVHPVAGHVPKRSEFSIVGGLVRYQAK